MTERKITYTLGRIKTCKESGCTLEALLKSYHLNIDLIRFILDSALHGYSFENKKMKTVLQEFLKEFESNPALKKIISKRSIKSLKPWLAKMDKFFKDVKTGYPKNLVILQDETDKIFGILKISVNKLFIRK